MSHDLSVTKITDFGSTIQLKGGIAERTQRKMNVFTVEFKLNLSVNREKYFCLDYPSDIKDGKTQFSTIEVFFFEV